MKYLADRTRQNRQNPPLSINIFLKTMKMKVTKLTKLDYSSLALGKISKSVLAGCKDYIGVHSPHWTFFVRNISMRSHLNGEAGEGHLRMCWLPMSPVCYLLQPRHQLAVNGKASIKYIGAHNHA